MLLELDDNGLYCAAGDFYVDPWRPVQRAVITHAHADHARPGSLRYLVAERGRGEQLTLPCFAFGVHYALLPAFGDFTGYVPIRPQQGGTFFVLTDDRLVRFDA